MRVCLTPFFNIAIFNATSLLLMMPQTCTIFKGTQNDFPWHLCPKSTPIRQRVGSRVRSWQSLLSTWRQAKSMPSSNSCR